MDYYYRITDEQTYRLFYLDTPLLSLEIQQLSDAVYCLDLLSGMLDVTSGPIIAEFAHETGNEFREACFLLQKLPLFCKKNDDFIFYDLT